jgi:hypothetical protein
MSESKSDKTVIIADINLDNVVPDKKDYERARGLRWSGSSFYGNHAPFGHQVKKMTKSIKDPYKLIRRSKAVLAVYGTQTTGGMSNGKVVDEINSWNEFRDALYSMGFNAAQIGKLASWRAPVEDQEFIHL